MDLWHIGDNMAKAATLMTDTSYTSRVLGSAWPGHFNKPIAEAMYENIKKVGLPQWSEEDQALAKALQKELKVPVQGPGHQDRRNCAPPKPQTDEDGDGDRRTSDRRRLRRYRRHLLECSDRDVCATRRIFPAGPGTTGPTRSRWRRRSRTKA